MSLSPRPPRSPRSPRPSPRGGDRPLTREGEKFRGRSYTMPPLLKVHEVSPIQSQKQMRLRVNRVALLQTMKVEHVINYLIEEGVITDTDQQVIMNGKSAQDRVKNLLDILPNKGKSVDWYKHFRDSLKNPEVRNPEIRKKYKILVEFLDNTIIHPPAKSVSPVDLKVISGEHSKSLSKYDPLPGISNSDSRGEIPTDSEVTFSIEAPTRGSYNLGDEEDGYKAHTNTSSRKQQQYQMSGKSYEITAPENFNSSLRKPKSHFRSLKESDDAADQEQLRVEEEAWLKMLQLEAVFSLYQAEKLPQNVEFCMTSIVEEILMDWKHHHLYFKYMDELEFVANTSTCIVKQLASSIINQLNILGDAKDEEYTSYMVRLAFRLTDFMRGYGMYYHAEAIIIALMTYLKTNPVLQNWMYIYEGFIKIMELRNTNLDFPGVEWAYNAAQNMARNIKMMSFGKNIIDEAEMYLQLNMMLLEQGSVTPAFHWAQSCIREVNSENAECLVNTLCAATNAYAMKWHLKRAQQLAVYAVQCARKHFGTNHPMYVKALIHLSTYLSEFWVDPFAIDIAKEALTLATKVYGGPTVQVAEAHQALAIAMAKNNRVQDGSYLDHAKRAMRIGQDMLPSEHPRLAPFRHTLAECHVVEAEVGTEEAGGNLLQADVEASSAAQAYNQFWGTYSLKTAHILVLMAEIFHKMDRVDDAEQALLNANGTLVLSMPAKSLHIYVVNVALAEFYEGINKNENAIRLYKEVVEKADTSGVHQDWLLSAHKSLIRLLDETDETEADHIRQTLKQWKKNNPKLKQVVCWELLEEEPVPYEDFLSGFDLWRDKVSKLRQGIHDLYLDKAQDYEMMDTES